MLLCACALLSACGEVSPDEMRLSEAAAVPAVSAILSGAPHMPTLGPIFELPPEPKLRMPVMPRKPDVLDRKLRRHMRVGRAYQIFGVEYQPRHDPDYDRSGIASWYGEAFHGRATAYGEPYDMHAYTAAHKTLPLGSLVEVENLRNGRRVILRINDRGPFAEEEREIDLSKRAAAELGILTSRFRPRVRVRYVGPGEPPQPGGTVTRVAAVD